MEGLNWSWIGVGMETKHITNNPLFKEMKFLYEQDELLNFIASCLGVSPITASRTD